jgi:hypothetical protein
MWNIEGWGRELICGTVLGTGDRDGGIEGEGSQAGGCWEGREVLCPSEQPAFMDII